MSVEILVWEKGLHALRTSAGEEPLRQWRASVLMRIQPHTELIEGLIDTGAPISIFPQKVWSRFSGDIEWLADEADQGLPDWLRFVGGLAGGTIPCRIGRVRVSLYGKLMRPVATDLFVTAKMVLDQHRLPHRVLLGLHGEPLDSGFYWSGGDAPRAWIDRFEAALTT